MRVVAADAILLVHFLFVLFVVGGLVLIWLGAWLGWRWIRGLKFRITHLAAIAFVAVESMLGVACPLTVWENTLRSTAGDQSFVAHWAHRLMFFSAPEWVFTSLYITFALWISATMWLIPSRRHASS